MKKVWILKILSKILAKKENINQIIHQRFSVANGNNNTVKNFKLFWIILAKLCQILAKITEHVNKNSRMFTKQVAKKFVNENDDTTWGGGWRCCKLEDIKILFLLRINFKLPLTFLILAQVYCTAVVNIEVKRSQIKKIIEIYLFLSNKSQKN